MRGFDLSRPDILYALIWGAVVLLGTIFPLAYIEPSNDDVLTIICVNIFTFLLIYKIIYYSKKSRKKQINPFDANREIYILSKFLNRLLFFWSCGYLVNIAASGGLPLIWLLTGDSRTYVDYGIPTFSGLLNMLRAFIFSGAILIFLKAKNKSYLLVAFLLLLSTFLEVSRGGISILLLHGVAIWVMQRRFRFLKLLLALMLFIAFIICFGLMAELRGHGVDVESLVGEQKIFLSLPSGFFWIYTYMVSPFNNLNFAANIGFEPLHHAYFSIQSLVPSVIRSYFFPEVEYPLQLANESFNATSYYGPIFADFGYIGAMIIVTIFQVCISYFHIKAKSGNVFYYLSYPAFFMAVVMSIFYSFLFSMIVILYPLLAMFYSRYRKNFIGTIQIQPFIKGS